MPSWSTFGQGSSEAVTTGMRLLVWRSIIHNPSCMDYGDELYLVLASVCEVFANVIVLFKLNLYRARTYHNRTKRSKQPHKLGILNVGVQLI